jgi:hypothetical protein
LAICCACRRIGWNATATIAVATSETPSVTPMNAPITTTTIT